jgi:hypothetical protein
LIDKWHRMMGVRVRRLFAKPGADYACAYACLVAGFSCHRVERADGRRLVQPRTANRSFTNYCMLRHGWHAADEVIIALVPVSAAQLVHPLGDRASGPLRTCPSSRSPEPPAQASAHP